MTTEERLSQVEQRQAEVDQLLTKLIAFASTTAKGRLALAVLGVRQ
jgi:hypothetical protein